MPQRAKGAIHLFFYCTGGNLQFGSDLPVTHVVFLVHPEDELLLLGEFIDRLLDQMVFFFIHYPFIRRWSNIFRRNFQEQFFLPPTFSHFIKKYIPGILPQQGKDGVVVLYCMDMLPEADVTFLHDIFAQMHFSAHGKQYGKELVMCFVNDPL